MSSKSGRDAMPEAAILANAYAEAYLERNISTSRTRSGGA
jgi:hypothetical protein